MKPGLGTLIIILRHLKGKQMNKTPKNLPILHIHEWEYPKTRHHKLMRKCKSCPVIEKLNDKALKIKGK